MGRRSEKRRERRVRAVVAGAVRRSANKPQSIKASSKTHKAGKPDQLAKYIASAMKKIQAIMDGVPRIGTVKQLSPKQRAAIAVAGSVPDKFLRDAVDANKKFPSMGAGTGIDEKKTENTIAQTAPLQMLTEFLVGQSQRSDDLRMQDRHKAGTASLQVYEQGKSRLNRGIAADGEEAAVEKMRKSLGKTRNHNKSGVSGVHSTAALPADPSASAKSQQK